MSTDSYPSPLVSISLDDLCDGDFQIKDNRGLIVTHERFNKGRADSVSIVTHSCEVEDLSLVPKSNEEIFPAITPTSSFFSPSLFPSDIMRTEQTPDSGRAKKTKQVDIQAIDFLGPCDTIKKLFSLPYNQDTSNIFSFHRMGNVLLVDSISSTDVANDFSHIESSSKQESLPSPTDQSSMVLNMISGSNFSGTLIPSLQSNHPRAYNSNDPASFHIASNDSNALSLASPLVPPPAYYMPSVPQPPKHVVTWNLHDMKLVVGTDLNVLNTHDGHVMTVNAIDTTKEFELSTCLDFYLDNVMVNVPELALALHAKGFIRGIRICNTNEIPFLTKSNITESLLDGNITSPIFKPTINPNPNPSVNPSANSNSPPSPVFDPKVIDMDATAIMRFLKSTCNRDDGTYILKKSPTGQSLHLYDLGLASENKQKRFKWMLSMISYRFAIRLGHHMHITNFVGKIQYKCKWK